MNRAEALRALGLDENATQEDIKVAYREMAQILHPDRFGSNKKLQDRATEQFKNLQEAYDCLSSGKGGASGVGSSRGSTRSTYSQAEAKLAGIAAARIQLVSQKDLALDERRNGLIMLAAGAIVTFALRRIVAIAGIASAIAVWGVVQVISSSRTISTIDEHLAKLKKEQAAIEKEMAEG